MAAGIVFIIAGLIGLFFTILIYKGHLEIIAGYNTMSKEKQDKVDRKIARICSAHFNFSRFVFN